MTDLDLDHGITGVLFVRKQHETWFVDTWLMSCRVIGRRLEHFMFKILLQAAKNDGCRKICGEYVPSEKNAQVQSLYPQFGFSCFESSNSFAISIDHASVPDMPIKDEKMIAIPASVR